jgi:protein-disulfide isomerase
MWTKALVTGIFGLFTLSGATCGKDEPADVTKEKDVAEVQLEGVDTKALTPREKKDWSKHVSELLAPCTSVPVPIAQCVKEKRDCAKCLPAAKYVLKGVKDGMTREQIEAAYKNRFDAALVKEVPLDGSPVMGSESAPITIVEFADFECPHCAQVVPLLDKVLDERKNEVRFVFKFFPLAGHPHADIAARAAIAAWRQGKFWQMHHALFKNQAHLEQTDLDSYAKELGLDVSRFHADLQAPETGARIAQDKKLGEDLKIGGTPSIYVNGRSFDGHQELGDWVTMDLSFMGVNTAPSPGNGAPAASATSALLDGGGAGGKKPESAKADAGAGKK